MHLTGKHSLGPRDPRRLRLPGWRTVGKVAVLAAHKKSRRGGTPGGVPPRRLTRQRAPRTAGLPFS